MSDQNKNTPQEEINTVEENKISKFCRTHLKVEAAIYSCLYLIITLPVLCAIGIYKGGNFLFQIFSKAFEWFINTVVVPIVIELAKITKYIIVGIFAGIAYLIKSIYSLIKSMIKGINWCAVRSLMRITSIIIGIISTLEIINIMIFNAPTSKIITGFFYSPDPNILIIHYCIAGLIIAITAYYNAWAYSKPEEIAFVCRRTFNLSKVGTMLSEALKKK